MSQNNNNVFYLIKNIFTLRKNSKTISSVTAFISLTIKSGGDLPGNFQIMKDEMNFTEKSSRRLSGTLETWIFPNESPWLHYGEHNNDIDERLLGLRHLSFPGNSHWFYNHFFDLNLKSTSRILVFWNIQNDCVRNCGIILKSSIQWRILELGGPRTCRRWRPP